MKSSRPGTRPSPSDSQAPATFCALSREHPELLAGAPEPPKPTGKPCPRCQSELLLRHGRKGAFLSCSGYPRCDYAADPSARPSQAACPKCRGPMEETEGEYGRYARCLAAGCGGKLDLPRPTDDLCPRCGARLLDRVSFLGCSSYPVCAFSVGEKALARAKKADKRCQCGALMLPRKGPKGPFWGCSTYPDCRLTEPLVKRPRGAGRAVAQPGGAR